MDRVQPGEVQVGAVQDVEGSRFDWDLIEDVDALQHGPLHGNLITLFTLSLFPCSPNLCFFQSHHGLKFWG